MDIKEILYRHPGSVQADHCSSFGAGNASSMVVDGFYNLELQDWNK